MNYSMKFGAGKRAWCKTKNSTTTTTTTTTKKLFAKKMKHAGKMSSTALAQNALCYLLANDGKEGENVYKIEHGRRKFVQRHQSRQHPILGGMGGVRVNLPVREELRFEFTTLNNGAE